jgi:hypothetical protein
MWGTPDLPLQLKSQAVRCLNGKWRKQCWTKIFRASNPLPRGPPRPSRRRDVAALARQERLDPGELFSAEFHSMSISNMLSSVNRP